MKHQLMSAFALLSAGFGLWKTRWGAMLGFGLLLYVTQLVAQFASFVASASFLNLFGTHPEQLTSLEKSFPILLEHKELLGSWGVFLLSTLIVIMTTVVSLWIFIATTRMLADVFSKKKGKGVGAYLSSAVSLVVPLAVVAFMILILIKVAQYLLVALPLSLVPKLSLVVLASIAIITFFMFAFYIVVFEKPRGIAALRESIALVRGRVWFMMLNVFIITIGLWILGAVLGRVIQYLFLMFFSSLPVGLSQSTAAWLDFFIQSLPVIIILPYLFSVQYRFYRNAEETLGKTSK